MVHATLLAVRGAIAGGAPVDLFIARYRVATAAWWWKKTSKSSDQIVL